MKSLCCSAPLLTWLLTSVVSAQPLSAEGWLRQKQQWERDTDGPVISLGVPGTFDDTHLFAPCVVRRGDHYDLWYCGSTGTVAERVFRLGLATSSDGRVFRRSPESPVFAFGDGAHSVLTPTIINDNGRLRMWFSATAFQDGSGLHTLHEATSHDGRRWDPPSPPLLEHVYAPSVLRVEGEYRLWYVDVSDEPWIIRHARSADGTTWDRTETPCLRIDQGWESGNLFYPTVIRTHGVFLMWYGSYWTGRANTTALGFAVSADGLTWHKHPANPVHTPDPDRPWESHYVTSQSVMQESDGSFQMWYASRKAPPFVNKYFAINTARWRPENVGSIRLRSSDDRR